MDSLAVQALLGVPLTTPIPIFATVIWCVVFVVSSDLALRSRRVLEQGSDGKFCLPHSLQERLMRYSNCNYRQVVTMPDIRWR